MQKQGFDNQIYITRQSEEIQRRMATEPTAEIAAAENATI